MLAQERLSPRKIELNFSRPRLFELSVCITVVLLISVRLFTERLGILPLLFNGLDIFAVPLLVLSCILRKLARHDGRFFGRRIVLLSVGLIVVSGASWILHADVVHWMGALGLPGQLLLPVAFYLALLNMNPRAVLITQVLLTLKVLFLINLFIGTFDTLTGWGRFDVDLVQGTFGNNVNQMAFFLALMVAYYLSEWRIQGLTWRGAVVLVWGITLFIICAFQTLWVVFAIAAGIVLIAMNRWSLRLVPMLVVAVLAPMITLSTLTFVRFSVVDMFGRVVDNFSEMGKVQLIKSAIIIYSRHPEAMLYGVGPGTFNSRAFRNIAEIPYFIPNWVESPTQQRGQDGDVAGQIIGIGYGTPLADEFIIPYFQFHLYMLTGHNTDGPFTSYVSIPMEIGFLGAICAFGIYAVAMKDLLLRIRKSKDPQVQLLATWAMIGILMLLGISIVDNYLEATRYTMLTWLTVALSQISVQKEPRNADSIQALLLERS